MKKEKVKTRFSVDLCGCFRFSKMLPEEALSVLVKMSEDYELGAEWYNEHFDIPYKIVAQECPWRLTADRQGLELIDDIGVINNNLFFIDWIAWIIMAFCLPNKVKMNGECSWVVFAWDFEVKSAERFAAFTALLGASGVELDCFNYDKVRDGLLGVGVRDFTLAEYQFMSRRIVDEHFVGEDEGLPCWQTMARVLGITPVDTSSITRILTAVFKNEPHIFTIEELLEKCRDADPTIAWTAGKIRGAIDRRALGGGAVILRYDRGRRNGEKTTFTVDAYVSDADKNVAREAVETLSNYLRETAFPVVSIYKTYKDCVSKLSSGFPQLCFYELVRMLGKDKLNCREYPRVGALGVACEINAYGDAARKEFARLGQRKASLEQLKTFLVNALHEDPLLADQSVRLMGLQRVSDERNADYLL